MGTYLSSPVTEKQTEEDETERFAVAAVAMQGWRTSMEDAHILDCQLDHDCSLFAIFDGHGGPEVAKFCQKHFAKQLVQSVHWAHSRYEEALRHTFLKMDELLATANGQKELKVLKLRNGQPSRAGCTALVVLIKGNTLYVANAGDSRAVLFKDKQVLRLSEDHSTTRPGEAERIEAAGGFIKGGRVNGVLNLTRAIGDTEFKLNANLDQEQQIIIAVPEITRRELSSENQLLVLACDGVWESLSEPEIGDYLQSGVLKGRSLAFVCEDLLDRCLASDTSLEIGCDNMSMIAVSFHST